MIRPVRLGVGNDQGVFGAQSMSILTTHVGSLPRSQQVVDMLFARERGDEYDTAAFDDVMRKATFEMVRKQVEAGIDVVSDGETSKISYATYVKDRYTGFAGDARRQPPADLLQFPSFLRRLASEGGTPKYSRPYCVGEIKPKGTDDLQKDIDNLKDAMREHGANAGFMNAPSPGVISLFLPNGHYASREEYLHALGQVMREEYRTIAKSGLYLQLDCPDLALSRHMLFTDLSDDEFVRVAAQNMEVLNEALEGIDSNRIRMHICWGNYEGPHTCDIGMDKMFDVLMSSRARYLLFETSNPRHAHEWTIFRERRGEIPEDKVLVPGVIDSTTNFVEHPEVVQQRLERFLEFMPKRRVMAGSDCGFGTFAGFGSVDPAIAYAKLKSLARGVKLTR